MPKIGNFRSSSETPCDRCQSPKRVAQTWVEELKNDNGVMIIRHKMIVCTNEACQKAFDKVVAVDSAQRNKLRGLKVDKNARRTALKVQISLASR